MVGGGKEVEEGSRVEWGGAADDVVVVAGSEGIPSLAKEEEEEGSIFISVPSIPPSPLTVTTPLATVEVPENGKEARASGCVFAAGTRARPGEGGWF